MRVPPSNLTLEGARDAHGWLRTHPEIPPRLRRAMLRYHKNAARDLPWRTTQDPYKILVAEMLLQKTATGPVPQVWAALTERYPTPEALALAPLPNLQRIVRPLGLQRKRAVTLHEMASRVVCEAEGEVPSDVEFLESLRGVGAYTTAALLSFAYDVKTAVIDVNAARVYTRVGGFAANTLRQALAFAGVVGARVVSVRTHKQVNYGVLDLAAGVCRPKPDCGACCCAALCQWAAEQADR